MGPLDEGLPLGFRLCDRLRGAALHGAGRCLRGLRQGTSIALRVGDFVKALRRGGRRGEGWQPRRRS
jgi:hypothetical protein